MSFTFHSEEPGTSLSAVETWCVEGGGEYPPTNPAYDVLRGQFLWIKRRLIQATRALGELAIQGSSRSISLHISRSKVRLTPAYSLFGWYRPNLLPSQTPPASYKWPILGSGLGTTPTPNTSGLTENPGPCCSGQTRPTGECAATNKPGVLQPCKAMTQYA